MFNHDITGLTFCCCVLRLLLVLGIMYLFYKSLLDCDSLVKTVGGKEAEFQ